MSIGGNGVGITSFLAVRLLARQECTDEWHRLSQLSAGGTPMQPESRHEAFFCDRSHNHVPRVRMEGLFGCNRSTTFDLQAIATAGDSVPAIDNSLLSIVSGNRFESQLLTVNTRSEYCQLDDHI